MEKRKSILIAMIVLQLALLFAANRFFVNDMKEDIERMKQELTSQGMPTEQVNTVGYALSKMKINVSAYVTMTTIVLVALNGLFIRLSDRKEDG